MAEEYLGQERSVEKTIAVGLSAVTIQAASDRKMFYIRNTSTGGERISIQLSNVTVPVDNTGVILNAGDFVTDSNNFDYKVWTGKITAICNGAGGTISYIER